MASTFDAAKCNIFWQFCSLRFNLLKCVQVTMGSVQKIMLEAEFLIAAAIYAECFENC